MQCSVDDAVEHVWPAERMSNKSILVAVSGGADSVACLLCLLQRCDETTTLYVGHFNHRLRGEESDDDERFVRQLCKKLGIQIIVGRSRKSLQAKPGSVEPENDNAAPRLASTEEHARKVRYAFLTDAAHQVGARYLVTAHTADDRVETIIHNLCRGTGLAGLAPLPPFRDLAKDLVLVRPLINVRRDELLDYLDDLKQTYRNDSSNASDQFTRNRIRHDVLPTLRRAISDQADKAILRCAKAVAEAQAYIEKKADELLRASLRSSGDTEVLCDADRLQAAEWVVTRQALQKLWRSEGWPESRLSQRHWESLRPLLADGNNRQSQAIQFPGNLKIERQHDLLRITVLESKI